MPRTVYEWTWEEAFSKYGFGDGDHCETYRIEEVLREAGWGVGDSSGVHNTFIVSLSKDGRKVEFNNHDADPESLRRTLPAEVVELLDAAFPDDAEFGP